ncbi:MAG: AAA family ATPase [Candidatus Aenigmarchaeota archaeon]|nr:AAA family ATPase [Candidatus Aenigmarchaeota archaeon]
MEIHEFGWQANPFSYRILPELFVGYADEVRSVLNGIRSGDKFILLLGPTGAGKTTLLQHIQAQLQGRVLYIPKPPTNPADWVTIFHPLLRSRLPFRGNGADIYTLHDKLNQKLRGKPCLLFVDECHEASMESLEWIRTLTDQVGPLTLVMAGLPIFENVLRDRLETFLRRFSVRIDLNSLSPAETRELVKRRIESVGGDDIRPFTAATLERIHDQTGGFPRDVLKVCNELAQQALARGLTTVDADFLKEASIPARVSMDALEALPSRQRLIVDTLAAHGDLTPTELVEKVQAKGHYKGDTDTAIRSVNNLLRRLMTDGIVERKKLGKAYKYRLAPRYQTLLVQA